MDSSGSGDKAFRMRFESTFRHPCKRHKQYSVLKNVEDIIEVGRIGNDEMERTEKEATVV